MRGINTTKCPLSVARLLASAPGFVAALLALSCAPGALGAGPAATVVLVANSADPDSVAIALHYAEVRGVPLANVIALPMPLAETITWKEFVGAVWRPLEEQLVAKGWIDALAMDLVDEVGRRKYSVSGHRIGALVTCRGVPLRIENDPALYKEFKPMTDHPEFRTNAGAVDSELSLLAQNDYPINAGIPNPFFANDRPTAFAYTQVVKVSRLDGPTASDALHLVDLAVEAERTGLLGRAYVDIAGPHENGDRWLESAARTLSALGFDLSVSHGSSTVPASARFDAPAFYFGWYAPDLNGPFELPGFRFPPGAVAVHIHSFSARTVRSDTEGWCGPLVARGVTATVGNVYEPYLEYLHRPDLIMEALARGNDWVDAAYYALPLLSWQAITIGDPLYRPFAVPLPAQTGALSRLPPDLAGYPVIRQMNLLAAAGRQHEAIEEGRAAMKKVPSLALALALARRVGASGNSDQSVWVVKAAAEAAEPTPGNWEVIREAAQFLTEHRRSAEAIELYRKLLSVDLIPPAVRAPWLEEARSVALEAGDTGQAAEWESEITRSALHAAGAGP